VPIAILTAAVATRELRESRVTGEHHYDIPGAVAVTAGLLSLVYGFTRAQLDGWARRPRSRSWRLQSSC